MNLLCLLANRRSTGVSAPPNMEPLSRCQSCSGAAATSVRSHLSGSNRMVDVAITAAQHNHNECFSSTRRTALSCSPPVLFSETSRPRPYPQGAINSKDSSQAASGSTYRKQAAYCTILGLLGCVGLLMNILVHCDCSFSSVSHSDRLLYTELASATMVCSYIGTQAKSDTLTLLLYCWISL